MNLTNKITSNNHIQVYFKVIFQLHNEIHNKIHNPLSRKEEE